MTVQQATKGTGFCQESGAAAGEEGFTAPGLPEASGAWPALSISQHHLPLSHAAALTRREPGPLSFRKLPVVAAVSCLLLAPAR